MKDVTDGAEACVGGSRFKVPGSKFQVLNFEL
jgi:hypothetical protein